MCGLLMNSASHSKMERHIWSAKENKTCQIRKKKTAKNETTVLEQQ